MTNEILWIILMIINFSTVLLSYKMFGKLGLYMWIPISVILANIQVVATLNLFGTLATLGNIIYGSGYLVTDILSEEYGKKEANKAVHIGFFTLIIFTLIMYICSSFDLIDNAIPFKQMYGIMPRIAIASLTAYIISNKHDTWAFEFWKRKLPKHLWLRNNLSTMISQGIDTAIFTVIAFYGILSIEEMKEIFVSTYLLKFIVAFLDTPFIYMAKKMVIKDGKK